jgi:hypothetical protein
VTEELEPPVKNQRDLILSSVSRHGFADRKVFIETGTALGETSRFASKHFEKVFTVEYMQDAYLHSLETFFYNDSVTYLKGDSKDVIPVINYMLDQTAVFFLDAHFSGKEGEEEEMVAPSGHTPVVAELTDIVRYPYDHVILIDDARLFGKNPHYPTLKQIEEIAAAGDFGGYVTNVEGDVIVITRSKDWIAV